MWYTVSNKSMFYEAQTSSLETKKLSQRDPSKRRSQECTNSGCVLEAQIQVSKLLENENATQQEYVLWMASNLFEYQSTCSERFENKSITRM